jgi:hypothetical protein
MGTNTVNVGSLAPSLGGVLNAIQGSLSITGSGGDKMNVDDSGSSTSKTGNLTPTTIAGLGMGPQGITYNGVTMLNLSLGFGKNSFAITVLSTANLPATTTVNGGSNIASALTASFAQDFIGMLNLLGFPTISSISVSRDFLGNMNVGAPSVITLMTVGRDFAGNLVTGGTLQMLSIVRSSPGFVSAGMAGTVSAQAAAAVKDPITGRWDVLRIQENGVQRQLEVTPVSPANWTGVPPTVPTFKYYYESTAAGVTAGTAQIAIRVSNPSPSTLGFDLGLAVYNVAHPGATITSTDTHDSQAKFTLDRLDAVATGSNTAGLAGLRSLSVEGDLVVTVSLPAVQFLGLTGNAGGVQLPGDAAALIAVRDLALNSSVLVKTIQAMAFGESVEESNTVQTGALGQAEDATDILVNSVGVIQAATGTYRLQVGLYPVALMLGQSNGTFNAKVLVLNDPAQPPVADWTTVVVSNPNTNPPAATITYSSVP